MRVPDTLEKNTIIELAAAGNDDKLYELMASFDLPDEVASRWYASVLDYEGDLTVSIINHLFNKAWV